MVEAIKMNPQEMDGNINFYNTFKVMTSNFIETFGERAQTIVSDAVSMVMDEHPDGADYMQTFKFTDEDGKETRFWLMVDHGAYEGMDVLTALLPEDY